MRHGEPVATSCATTSASSAAEGVSASSALPIVSPRLGHKQGCCSAADADDARRVADRLDIPFYAIDFQEDFRQIIEYFIDEYAAARTPNPCVVCNNWIKFGRLFDYADSVGAHYVATGHYARLIPAADGDALPGLARCRRSQRSVVRAVRHPAATAAAHAAADRRLPQGRHPRDRARPRPQRGRQARQPGDSVSCPKAITPRSSAASAALRPRPARSSPATARSSASTTAWSDSPSASARDWASPWANRASSSGWKATRTASSWAPKTNCCAPSSPRSAPTGTSLRRPTRACTVKIRYNARPVAARVTALDGNRLHVAFDQPQHAIAPGQAVVCYDGPRVLGGGWIE